MQLQLQQHVGWPDISGAYRSFDCSGTSQAIAWRTGNAFTQQFCPVAPDLFNNRSDLKSVFRERISQAVSSYSQEPQQRWWLSRSKQRRLVCGHRFPWSLAAACRHTWGKLAAGCLVMAALMLSSAGSIWHHDQQYMTLWWAIYDIKMGSIWHYDGRYMTLRCAVCDIIITSSSLWYAGPVLFGGSAQSFRRLQCLWHDTQGALQTPCILACACMHWCMHTCMREVFFFFFSGCISSFASSNADHACMRQPCSMFIILKVVATTCVGLQHALAKSASCKLWAVRYELWDMSCELWAMSLWDASCHFLTFSTQ